jgi:HK97 family phage prohead protease
MFDLNPRTRRRQITGADALGAVARARLRMIEENIAADSQIRAVANRSEYRYTGKDIRAESTAGRKILRGYALVFGALSQNLGAGGEPWRERINLGSIDAAKLKNDRDFAMLWSHDQSQVLAHVPETLSVDVDGKGLRFVAQMADTSLCRDAFENVRVRNCVGMSFAMRVLKDDLDWIDVDDIEDPDEDEQARSKIRLRTVERCSISEISAVVWPAYKSGDIQAATRALFPLGPPETMPLELRSAISAAAVPHLSTEALRELQIRARLLAAQLQSF